MWNIKEAKVGVEQKKFKFIELKIDLVYYIDS